MIADGNLQVGLPATPANLFGTLTVSSLASGETANLIYYDTKTGRLSYGAGGGQGAQGSTGATGATGETGVSGATGVTTQMLYNVNFCVVVSGSGVVPFVGVQSGGAMDFINHAFTTFNSTDMAVMTLSNVNVTAQNCFERR